MLSCFLPRNTTTPDLASSKLFNEQTFYPSFTKDLKSCQSELLIEYPFVTNRRLNQLLPAFQKLKERKVRLVVNTRDPQTNDDEDRREDAHRAISKLQNIGCMCFTLAAITASSLLLTAKLCMKAR